MKGGPGVGAGTGTVDNRPPGNGSGGGGGGGDESFDDGTLERMLGHLRCVLIGMAQDTEQEVGRVPMLGAKERRELVEGFNRPRSTVASSELTLHSLFEQQAERTPNAIAVWSAAQTLTYAEVNERAGHLARRLRRLGLDRE